eukprot:737873-Pelagomonas_calceolata.AAC.2
MHQGGSERRVARAGGGQAACLGPPYRPSFGQEEVGRQHALGLHTGLHLGKERRVVGSVPWASIWASIWARVTRHICSGCVVSTGQKDLHEIIVKARSRSARMDSWYVNHVLMQSRERRHNKWGVGLSRLIMHCVGGWYVNLSRLVVRYGFRRLDW